MLANFHTHTTFCDGKSTPEQVVASAIEKGFSAIGFSGHGYTPYDLRYCMKDTEGYIREILHLREKYRGKIRIFLGVEEDAFAPVARERFDYIIGSCHYFRTAESYLPIDSSFEHFRRCIEAADSDALRLAQAYYASFCAYICERKPDIIGHFDLVTKFEEVGAPPLLGDAQYEALAEKYLRIAAKSGCVFEVNTGAITRGLRRAPYPSEALLRILKKEEARLILSADSHSAETLDAFFAETVAYLRDLGFRSLCTLGENGFVSYSI